LRASGQAMARLDAMGGLEEGEAELFVVHAEALAARGMDAESAEVRRRGSARVQQIADRIRDGQWRERFLKDVPANRELMDPRAAIKAPP
ncbi:MAG TPA: hypothetical protein VLS89_21220, partial [Candidatus Nanopelagicales bacterium]|nr:hypothetical protein [Candidatus Nanopelagicales bacterium]